MKNITRIMLTGLFLSALLCLQAQIPDLDTKYATEMLKPGTSAPDFKLQTPDGKTIQFSDFAKGKYVVIDFWASWCPDCRKDMPEVIRMYNKWHEMGVEFLGVSFDTDKQKWTD